MSNDLDIDTGVKVNNLFTCYDAQTEFVTESITHSPRIHSKPANNPAVSY